MKRAFTLLEVMIVILLITIITGAVGYNMKGTLEKGKVFRTERAMEQLRDLLLYCNAEAKDAERIAKNAEKAISSTGLAKNPHELLKDGWGVPFEIKVKGKNDFIIRSERLENYRKAHDIGLTDVSNVTMDDGEEEN